LPRDGAALRGKSFLQAILAQANQRDEVERFGIMNIEPAGMAKRSIGSYYVALYKRPSARAAP